ncbi:hypothetical protein V1281_006469 [Nitrobacteraceae bacterium AZCC 2161]
MHYPKEAFAGRAISAGFDLYRRDSRLFRRFWQYRRRSPDKAAPDRHKSEKDRRCPFPKQPGIGTYPSHRGLCPGCLLRKPPDWDRSAPLALADFVPYSVSRRFGAGWSSPVARQAHNLKVIGSNPIPATKLLNKNPAISIDCWVFVLMLESAPITSMT